MSSDGLRAVAASVERGTPFRAALECLLRDLEPAASAELQQLLREGRAAWLPLLHAGPGARALLVGNACSGTAVALARAGLRLTVLDSDPARLAFARVRDAALGAGCTEFVASSGPHLPFADGAFDLVVRESRTPPLGHDPGFDEAELARVSANELLTVEDNRFAYKRSSGRRADFAVSRPLEFARAALAPAHGARSLPGHRRERTAAGLPATEALALYPHAHDFTYVAGLDGSGPELLIGPKERANRAKLLGYRAGLFPWLTPSFAILGRRRPDGRRRIDRWLAQVAERLGTAPPRLEHLVASRGNCAVMLTAAADGSDDPAGRWCVHAAFGPHAERQSRRHAAFTRWIAGRFPHLPVPEPLFEGELEGRWIGVERRLPGLGSPQQQSFGPERATTHREVAEALGRCLTEPAHPLNLPEFDRLVQQKLERVTARTADLRVNADLGTLVERARELLLGEPLPRAPYHSDLRAKHVQVHPDGRLAGLLDWGSAERADLPYFDVLNLVLHDRKQARTGEIGDAWRELHGLGADGATLRPAELATLDAYARAAGLTRRARVAIELLFPVLVAAMAEGNWDYSRPRWVARSFGLGTGRPLPDGRNRLDALA